ncbi:hypothetical protein MPC1_17400001 [Methylocella tundrae]|nr:hypothetical protein MPC1_17400001 [Methylocella tundrae]
MRHDRCSLSVRAAAERFLPGNESCQERKPKVNTRDLQPLRQGPRFRFDGRPVRRYIIAS